MIGAAVRSTRGVWRSPLVLLELALHVGVVLFAIATVFIPFWSGRAVKLCKDDQVCWRWLRQDATALQLADVADHQLNAYWGGLLPLVVFLTLFTAGRQLLARCGSSRLATVWQVCASLGFLAALHGEAAAIPLTCIVAQYAIVQVAWWIRSRVGGDGKSRSWVWVAVVGLAWSLPLAIRVVAEVAPDHAKPSFLLTQSVHVLGLEQSIVAPAVALLRGARGMLPWQSTFPLLMLRLISFAVDGARAAAGLELPSTKDPKAAVSGGRVVVLLGDDRQEERWLRAAAPRAFPTAAGYGLAAFAAYALYPPFLLTGPTLTYNAWAHGSGLRSAGDRSGDAKTSFRRDWRAIALYFARTVLAGALLLIGVRICPVFAISRSRALAWGHWTVVELSAFSLSLMTALWLKFLFIWRVARFFALVDGTPSVENMGRCVHNTLSISDFWRSWHRSYYVWLLRYIYHPLGGSSRGLLRQCVNAVVVFMFVAMWHDANANLVAWGLLFGVMYAPEALGSLAARRAWGKALDGNDQPWTRHVLGVGSGLAILVLVIANAIGFAVGVEAATNVLRQLLGTLDGLRGLALGFVVIFSGTQLMIWSRAARGPDGRCCSREKQP